jgi:hypothetical protein
MQRPQPIPGVPPGLEYLSQIDQMFVQQIPSLLEAFTGWESNSKFVIRNAAGQQCYYAFEDSDACQRQCCGPQRGFEIFVVDNMNKVSLLNKLNLIKRAFMLNLILGKVQFFRLFWINKYQQKDASVFRNT